jgi:hypothetical protein
MDAEALEMAYGVRVWSVTGPPRRGSARRGQASAAQHSTAARSFQHFRGELGAQVCGALGIAREDTARHAAAVLRNWEFFRAPLAGIVCMHRDLGPADALSVGMFLQTLLLALTERGLASCVDGLAADVQLIGGEVWVGIADCQTASAARPRSTASEESLDGKYLCVGGIDC